MGIEHKVRILGPTPPKANVENFGAPTSSAANIDQIKNGLTIGRRENGQCLSDYFCNAVIPHKEVAKKRYSMVICCQKRYSVVNCCQKGYILSATSPS